MTARWRRLLPGTIALATCAVVASATALPAATNDELAASADRFGFERVALNEAPPDARYERDVAPGIERIESWISAVGAAVGLTDLRGLGRPADACLVDPRDDSVRVLPVPGAGGPAYESVTLDPAPLPYDRTMAPMGCVPADLNADGAMDVTVYYWGRSPVMFLGRPGSTVPGPDTFRPTELAQPTQIWNTTALSIADVDGDGQLDVAVGNYFPDGARVLDPQAADDDRMAMQAGMGQARNAGVNRLLLGHPTGTPGQAPRFTDASVAFPDESARSWTLAFGLQDLDRDLRPEIYVANDFGPDQMLVNESVPGRPRFRLQKGERDATSPRSTVLGHDSFKGMGVAYSYSTGDDAPSLMVSNITTDYALHESNFFFEPQQERPGGQPEFRDRAQELGVAHSGWSWDVKAGDFDNSGQDEFLQATGFLQGDTNRWSELQELAMSNDQLLSTPAFWPTFRAGSDLSGHEPNRFWARDAAGERFQDLSTALGIDQPDISRGLALGDVDGDGRLDALVANQWQDSVLLRNTAADVAPAAFVRLVRTGPGGTERPLIGATVEWSSGGKTRRTQLFPSNGHAGVSGPQVHLPMPEGGPSQVTVSWRDAVGTHRSTLDVPPGQHTIRIDDQGRAVLS